MSGMVHRDLPERLRWASRPGRVTLTTRSGRAEDDASNSTRQSNHKLGFLIGVGPLRPSFLFPIITLNFDGRLQTVRGRKIMKTLLMSALLECAGAAQAQTSTIRPDGLGGYRVYTPPSFGSDGAFNSGGTTTIRPDGLGGYRAYTPPSFGSDGQFNSGGTTTIRPDGLGGYRVNGY